MNSFWLFRVFFTFKFLDELFSCYKNFVPIQIYFIRLKVKHRKNRLIDSAYAGIDLLSANPAKWSNTLKQTKADKLFKCV